VDESVVKCGGPTAVGVGCCRRVHEATHLSGWVFPPLTRTTENALRLVDWEQGVSETLFTDRGACYREAVLRAGFHNHVHQTFGVRSSVERFRATSKTGRGLSTTTSIRRRHSLHHSWTSSNYSCTGTRRGGDIREGLSGHYLK